MQTFFKSIPEQKSNGKWTAQYMRFIKNGPTINERKDSWDKEFDSKEEADKYATGYCLQQGWIEKK